MSEALSVLQSDGEKDGYAAIELLLKAAEREKSLSKQVRDDVPSESTSH